MIGFKQFILEDNEFGAVDKLVKDIRQKQNIYMKVKQATQHAGWYLSEFNSGGGARPGAGSIALKRLLQLADQYSKDVSVVPVASDRSKQGKLELYYKAHGFIYEKDKGIWIRYAKKNTGPLTEEEGSGKFPSHIALKDLHIWQSRSDLSKKKVEYYRDILREGGELRPILVSKPKWAKESGAIKSVWNTNKPWVVMDGHHRYEAAKLEGIKKLPVRVT